jgi:hypothetical protein
MANCRPLPENSPPVRFVTGVTSFAEPPRNPVKIFIAVRSAGFLGRYSAAIRRTAIPPSSRHADSTFEACAVIDVNHDGGEAQLKRMNQTLTADHLAQRSRNQTRTFNPFY